MKTIIFKILKLNENSISSKDKKYYFELDSNKLYVTLSDTIKSDIKELNELVVYQIENEGDIRLITLEPGKLNDSIPSIFNEFKSYNEISTYVEYSKLYEERIERQNKENNLVLWPTYKKLQSMPNDIYQGGFTNELFNNQILQDYINTKFVNGWIGDNHSRRIEHDIAIENGLRMRGASNNLIATWLTSTNGRHFADKLYKLNLRSQLIVIDENLNAIFNKALVYSSTLHKGTLKSTIEIYSDYKQQGILLEE